MQAVVGTTDREGSRATRAPGATERVWAAMGTTARIVLTGPAGEAATATVRDRVAELEHRWSRFLPDSDISRINAGAGQPVPVHAETLELLEQARAWWQATGGLFDPTVLDALEAAGYDRDRFLGHGAVRVGRPAPGCAGLELDPEALTAMVPTGVRVDVGGIGKGRAVDLVAEELVHHPGGLVDLGGDLRAWGRSPGGDGWAIEVEDLRDGSPVALLGLQEGAVATSSTLRRRWTDGASCAHHLIDPRTGRPGGGEVVTVTVVAARTAPAEVLAKAALLTGTVDAARALLEAHDVAALVVPADGPPAAVGAFVELCWIPPERLR